MAIELVEVDEMRTGRGGGKKGTGERYPKYRVAVAKILPWIQEQIAEKETIRVKNSDIAREMGKEFEGKHTTSFTWAMKYVLFNEGIWTTTGKMKDDQPVLIMRAATENDVLPDSLAKLEKEIKDVGSNEVDEEKEEDKEEKEE